MYYNPMWEHFKDSVQTCATSLKQDISGQTESRNVKSSQKMKKNYKDAMKNVVTPKSIPQFTLPPMLSHDLEQHVNNNQKLKKETNDCTEFSDSSSKETSIEKIVSGEQSDQVESSINQLVINNAAHLPVSQLASRRNRTKQKFYNQQSQPGLSLHHLLSTKSGFSTLTESPNTRRKESLFLSTTKATDLTNSSKHSSASNRDLMWNATPTASSVVGNFKSKKMLGRNEYERDSRRSSDHTSPVVSPDQQRKISSKPSLDSYDHASNYTDFDSGVGPATASFVSSTCKPSNPPVSESCPTAENRNLPKHIYNASIDLKIKENCSEAKATEDLYVSAEHPSVHVLLAYLSDQQRLNVSIIEGKQFETGHVVYLKILMLPRCYGQHRTDFIKITKPTVKICERLTFEPVKAEDLTHLSLEITCKEKLHRFRNSNIVGRCTITLCDMDSTPKDLWVDLKSSIYEETPHIQLSLCYHAMLGFITVEVIAARNIPKGTLGRYQDCYVALNEEPHNDKSTKKQTKISHRNRDPVFHESFIFSMPSEKLIIVATLFVRDKVKGHWTESGDVKLGYDVEHWSGKMHWVQSLDREGQPITFWHMFKLT